jgi:hypothetical protein
VYTTSVAMSTSTRVYVGGLSYRARERDVERYFKKFGRIRDVSMKNGYCFLEFEDARDADDGKYSHSQFCLLETITNLHNLNSG